MISSFFSLSHSLYGCVFHAQLLTKRNIEKYVDVLLFIISISSVTPPSRRGFIIVFYSSMFRVSHDENERCEEKERTKNINIVDSGDWHLCTSQCCWCWTRKKNIKDSWALDGQNEIIEGMKFNLKSLFFYTQFTS